MGKTKNQRSFAGKLSINRKAVIIPIILIILLGNFFTQIFFIKSSEPNYVRVEPRRSSNLNIPELPPNKTKVHPANDIVVETIKPLQNTKKIVEPTKIVNRDSGRQIHNKLEIPVKKESKRDSKAQRLRNAEKILTGF